jgi:hypothetical protein
MSEYQPKTGERCTCRRGVQRDNCPTCEGTGQKIDFVRIRRANGVPINNGPLTVAQIEKFVGGRYDRP